MSQPIPKDESNHVTHNKKVYKIFLSSNGYYIVGTKALSAIYQTCMS